MSEAGDIKIKISSEGATQAAAGVDKLTASLEKQRKTQEMIAKTSAQLKQSSVIDQLKKEAAEVNGATTAIQRHQAAVEGASNAFTGLGNNTQQLRSKLGPAAALIGNLGGSISQLVPELSTLTMTFQRTGMAAGQMLGVLGGGPGILVGGLIAGVTALATYMSSATKEAEDLAKATQDNADAMGDWLQQIQKARGIAGQRISGTQQEGDLQRRLAEGEGSVQEYQTELAARREMLNQKYSVEALTSARKSGGQDAVDKLLASQEQEGKQLDQLTEQYASAAAAAQQFADAKAQSATDAASISNSEKFIKDPKKQAAPDIELSDSNAYLMDQVGGGTQWAADTDFVQSIQKQREDATKTEFDKKTEMADAHRQLELDKENQFQESLLDDKGTWLGQQFQLVSKHESDKKKLEAETAQATVSAQHIITGATLKGISEVIKGKKLEFGAILEGLGDQFVAAGTGLVFTGLGLSANPLFPGSGSGMVSIGTAEIAFGLGLGAAGARMPGGSNAGGSAGASKPAADSYGGPSSDPYKNTFTPPEAGPTIINITMPTVLSPSPEDAIRMKQAFDAATNVYGPAATPNFARP